MWLLAFVSCTEPPKGDGPPDPTEPSDDTQVTEHSAASPPLAHSADSGHTGALPTDAVFDCATIPAQPPPFREVDGPRGYHDLAFLDDGTVLGNSVSGDLGLGDAYGGFALAIPGTGLLEQMVWMPDGDLAAGSLTRGILRITTAGSVTPINPNIRPYGLILGPDGLLWAADQRSVWAVDPVTGAAEEIVPPRSLERGDPRVIAFDLSNTHLYIGTIGGSQGRIYRVPLGPDYRPTAQAEVFATGVGRGGYHDAIGVDVCGYLYVPDYDTSNLYRVSPSGQVQLLLDSGFLRSDYGHGLEWGLGVGGFRDDAIYLPQPYDAHRVLELVIGVPSRDWTGGTAINLP
jgi:hypothetical protein